jgi:hypothetical protein
VLTVKKALCLLLPIFMAVFFWGCVSQKNETDAEPANGHPWREDYIIERMPVFRNPFHMLPAELAQHEGLSANRLSDEEMAETALSIIAAMGLEAHSTGIADARDVTWERGVTAAAENVRVTVEAHGFVQVVFENGMPLPDGLVFSWDYPKEAIVYLTERFAPVLGIGQTKNNENIVDRILEYHFNYIQFIPNSDGMLWQMSRFPPLDVVLTDKMGDFPIITPGEAVDRMLDGQGSFGVDMGQVLPAADEVTGKRLVYFGHSLGRNYLEHFAPWYELIVQTPDTPHLQSYFVPAIRSDYLDANPSWAVYPHQ